MKFWIGSTIAGALISGGGATGVLSLAEYRKLILVPGTTT